MSTDLLDKYGWPAAGLIVLMWFLWKGVWPLLSKRIEQADEIMRETAADLREKNEQLITEFMDALKRKDEISQGHTRELGKVAEAIDGLVQEVRRMQRKDTK